MGNDLDQASTDAELLQLRQENAALKETIASLTTNAGSSGSKDESLESKKLLQSIINATDDLIFVKNSCHRYSFMGYSRTIGIARLNRRVFIRFGL